MKLKQAIGNFIFYCQYERNLSDKTIKSYKTDLNQYLDFVGGKPDDPSSGYYDKDLVRVYLRQLFENYKPKSVKRKVATLKTLFNYLEFEDIININPFRKMKVKIQEGKILPKTIRLRDIKKLFKYLYSTRDNYRLDSYKYAVITRDICVLELLFGTGMRVAEVSDIKTDHLYLEQNTIKINGKGSRERIVPICNIEIKNFLKEYSRLFNVSLQKENYFFINRLGNRLSEQSIRFMIRKHTKNAGIKEHITPHMFRHSVATYLLENGVDISYIQHLLGHSSIMTTQIYAHVKQSAQMRAIKKKHPRLKF